MSDWEPLASSDPVPGQPDRIDAVASQLIQIAETIGKQAGRLRGVSAEEIWTGDAADRFEADKEDLPPLLDIVQERYREAGSALARYAPELRAAQELARRALAQARAAEADIASADRGIDRMDEYAADERARVRAAAQAYPDRPAPRPVPWSGPNYHYLLGDARADLESARDLLDQAIAQNETAGHSAAVAINNAIHDDIRNTFRSRADAAIDAMSDAARWLTEHLPIEELSAILGAIAAVASLIALLIPVTAVVLGPVAAIAGGIKLALDIVLWAADDFSFEKFVDIAITVIIMVATAGLGHIAKSAASSADDAWRAASAIGGGADDLARASRYAQDARAFKDAKNLLGTADDISTVLGSEDDLRLTRDIYQSHPLVWNAPGFVLPGGQMAGPIAAAWLYHNDHQAPAPPPPGSTIAPISPLDPALR